MTRHRWVRLLGPLAGEARAFARSLGGRADSAGVLVVGSPAFEPWHFTAHLAEEADRLGRPDLRPTLLRWSVPPGSRPHLSVAVDQGLAEASRHHTLLVVDPFGGAPELLDRVTDVRARGSRILTIHRDSAELRDLSHETLSVDSRRPPVVFDATQHVVTHAAAATPLSPIGSPAPRRPLWTARAPSA